MIITLHKKRNRISLIVLVLIIILLFFLHFGFDRIMSKLYLYKIEKTVLMHYKSEPNSLKYRSAQFLLENLSYHSSYSVDDAKEFEDVYATMANYPRELRDSVIYSKIRDLLRIPAIAVHQFR